MSVYKMSKSETMKFIQLYRDKQCLWYPYHENYKNQDERYEAANSIAIEMNMEGFGAHEVIRKFKNLRSSYCQELKKIKKSDNSYKPKVSWFKLMDNFIKPYVHQKPTVIQDIFEEYQEDSNYMLLNERLLPRTYMSDNNSASKRRSKYDNYGLNYYETTNANRNEYNRFGTVEPSYSYNYKTNREFDEDNPNASYNDNYGVSGPLQDYNDNSSDILKNKWRNLRDTYGKHLKSISPLAGPNVKKSYKHWQWANHMEYFRPFLSYAYMTTTYEPDVIEYDLEQNSNTTFNTYNSELNDVTPIIEETTTLQSHQHFSYQQQSAASVLEQEIDFLPINYKSKPIKREDDKYYNKFSDYLLTSQHQPIESLVSTSYEEQSLQKYSSNNDDSTQKSLDLDATELIFLGYARTIKTFSPRRQSRLKMRLAQMITEEEEQDEEDLHQLNELALSAQSSLIDYPMPGGGSAGSPSSPGSVPIAPKKLSSIVASTSSMPSTLPSSTPSVPPPPPPEVCLRWNSYHSNMQATFPTLLNNEQFVDVTLACEGRSIKCHKVMLSACSSYFEELLSQNPCQHPIVFMRDLKFWEVQALVEFMYSGEVNVAQEKLPSLLAAAEALQIKGLTGPTQTSIPQDESDYIGAHESEDTPLSQSAHKRVRKRKSTNPMAYPSRQSQPSPKQMPMMHPIVQLSNPTSLSSASVSGGGVVGGGMSTQPHSQTSSPNRKDSTSSSSSYHPPIKIKKERESTPPLALIKEEPLDLGKDSILETGSNNGNDLSNASSYHASISYDRSQYSGRTMANKPQNGLSDEEDRSSTHSNQSDDCKSIEEKPDPGDDTSDV